MFRYGLSRTSRRASTSLFGARFKSPIYCLLRDRCPFSSLEHPPSSKPVERKISSKRNSTEVSNTKQGPIVKFVQSLQSLANSTISLVRNPKETWGSIKEVANHYWLGSKLLWSETKIAYSIVMKLARGSSLTRREHMQLMRTSGDILRLVPFSVFIIVPFMEFLLPFALKLFPNMLPSTFQDNLKKEEALKNELKMRISVAKFLQETLLDLASKKRKAATLEGESDNSDTSNAREVLDFMERVRVGEHINNDSITAIARHFRDELTLSNVGRPQLVSMCRYMGLQPYGTDAFLRFQLRNKLRSIKEDDRRILWEGIDSLDLGELKEACRTRGMRSFGLTPAKIKAQLKEWLDLSIQKEIPIMLLIMSRAFALTSGNTSGVSEEPEQSLARSMSSLDPDIINEVIVAAASPMEQDTADIRQRKLESLKYQNQMIALEESAAATNDEKDKKTTGGADDLPKAHSSAEVFSASALEQVGALTSILSNSTFKSSPDSQRDTPAGNSQSSENPRIEDSGLLHISTDAALPSPRAQYAHSDRQVESNRSAETRVSAAGKAFELSYQEMEALGNLAQGSTVYSERSELAKMLAKKVDEDENLKRLSNVITSMLSNLEIKIDLTEKALLDKMELLDHDGDGKLSTSELRQAIVKILKRPTSVEEAEELVRILDQDQDGQVSVVELMQYIRSKKRPAPSK